MCVMDEETKLFLYLSFFKIVQHRFFANGCGAGELFVQQAKHYNQKDLFQACLVQFKP